MRKHILMAALLLTAATMNEAGAQVTPPGPTAAATPPAVTRIAFVDSQRLLQEAPGAREAQTTITREAEKYRAELALAEDSINTMITDYEQRQAMLSPDAKKKREGEILAKRTSFENRSKQYETQMQRRQQELVAPIMERVNKALDDERKEGGFAIVIDVASRAIISADTTLNLTEKVIARLKAASSAAAPKKPGS